MFVARNAPSKLPTTMHFTRSQFSNSATSSNSASGQYRFGCGRTLGDHGLRAAVELVDVEHAQRVMAVRGPRRDRGLERRAQQLGVAGLARADRREQRRPARRWLGVLRLVDVRRLQLLVVLRG